MKKDMNGMMARISAITGVPVGERLFATGSRVYYPTDGELVGDADLDVCVVSDRPDKVAEAIALSPFVAPADKRDPGSDGLSRYGAIDGVTVNFILLYPQQAEGWREATTFIKGCAASPSRSLQLLVRDKVIRVATFKAVRDVYLTAHEAGRASMEPLVGALTNKVRELEEGSRAAHVKACDELDKAYADLGDALRTIGEMRHLFWRCLGWFTAVAIAAIVAAAAACW